MTVPRAREVLTTRWASVSPVHVQGSGQAAAEPRPRPPPAPPPPPTPAVPPGRTAEAVVVLAQGPLWPGGVAGTSSRCTVEAAYAHPDSAGAGGGRVGDVE